MSSNLSQIRSRALPLPLPSRPTLALAPKAAAARASRIPFAVFVLGLLTAGLLGLLLLNTSLQRGAYVQSDLQSRADILARQQQSLELAVQSKSDPQHIAEAATRLGMVQSTRPAFLELKTNTVTGNPRAGVAGQSFLPRHPHRANPAKNDAHHVSTVVSGTTGAVTVKPVRAASTANSSGDTRGTSDGRTQDQDRKNTDGRPSQQ